MKKLLIITPLLIVVVATLVLIAAPFTGTDRTEAAIDITGIWNVNLRDNFGAKLDTCVDVISQTGSALSITIVCAASGSGSLSGSLIKATGEIVGLSGTVGGVSVSFTGTTDGSSGSGTWVNAFSQSGTYTMTKKLEPPTKQPFPGDTDGDGCPDVNENLPKSQVDDGGGRDWQNRWDYYDVNGDGVITLLGDILPVILHFAPDGYPTGQEAEYAVFDRGPAPPGANRGEMTVPDEKITLLIDIVGVILQFNPSGCTDQG